GPIPWRPRQFTLTEAWGQIVLPAITLSPAATAPAQPETPTTIFKRPSLRVQPAIQFISARDRSLQMLGASGSNRKTARPGRNIQATRRAVQPSQPGPVTPTSSAL